MSMNLNDPLPPKRVRKQTNQGAQYRAQIEAQKARAIYLKEKKIRDAREQKELDELMARLGNITIGGKRNRNRKNTRKNKRKNTRKDKRKSRQNH